MFDEISHCVKLDKFGYYGAFYKYNGMNEFPWNIARRNISHKMDVNMRCGDGQI